MHKVRLTHGYSWKFHKNSWNLNFKFGWPPCIMMCTHKIALSSNDDKKLQTSDRITTYPYGTDEMIMIKQS